MAESKTDKKEKKDEKKRVLIVRYRIKDIKNNEIIESNFKEDRAIIKSNEPVCILEGAGMCFRKIDLELQKAREGDTIKLNLDAKDAYGQRSRDKLRVVSLNDFKENGIRPFVGMQVNADGLIATVRSINGGRVMLDFNSPFADRDVEVTYKIEKIPEGKEKIEAFVYALIPKSKIEKIEHKKDKVKIYFKEEGSSDIYKAMLNTMKKHYFEKEPVFE